MTAINRVKKSVFNSNKTKSKLLGTTMLTAASAFIFSPGVAMAGNAWVLNQAGGSFNTDTSVNNVTHITQNSKMAIGEGNLSIAGDQTVNISQGSSHDLFVGRDTTGNPALILGSLNANGRVMVLDRNGVLFGANSRIDVNSIIVSTGDVSNEEIMSGGKLHFSNFGSGKIELNGEITVADAGVAAFVSPFISNNGVINAKLGTVAFAAGNQVTLDLYGDDLIEIAVSDKLADALIENKGKINAAGGNVIVTAQAAKQAVDNVINMDGVTDVSSVTQAGGKIVLNGGGAGRVNVSGTLNADNGSISVAGKNTSFTGTINAHGAAAKVDVSGDALSLGGLVNMDDGEITFDPATLTIDAAAATTFESMLSGSGSGTINVTADDKIILNATIDSSAETNTKTLNFKDHTPADALEVDLNDKVILGANQKLKGDATLVKVSANGLINNGIGVASSTKGAEVDVAAGTFTEDVVINKDNINLKGAQAGVMGWDPSRIGASETIINPSSPGITISKSTGDTVDGFYIDGASDGIFGDRSSNLTIKNNIVKNSSDDGIFVSKGDVVLVDGNLVDDSGNSGPNKEGISVHGNDDVTITNNIVIGSGDDNIQVDEADNSTVIQHNTVIGPGIAAVHGSDGIEVHHSNHVDVSYNEASGVHDQGIDILDTDNLTVNYNLIHDTKYDGINIDTSDTFTVYGNQIGYTDFVGTAADPGNIGRYGIRLLNTSNGFVQQNGIVNIAGGGIYLGTSGNIFVSNNSIGNAGVDGVEIEGGNGITIDSNNIWNAGYDGIYADNVGDLKVSDGYAGNIISGAHNNGIEIIGSAGAKALGNFIYGTGANGIYVTGSDGALIDGNYVGFNQFFDPQAPGNIGGNGIQVTGGTFDSIISNNHVINAALNGIEVGDGGGNGGVLNQILSNDVTDSGNADIFGSTGEALFVFSNSTHGGAYGIYLADINGALVEYNGVDGALVNGITATGSSNVSIGVQYPTGVIPGNQFTEGGNTVTNSGQVGIEVGYGGTGNIVGNNTVDTAGNDGIYVHDTDNVDIDTNEVLNVGSGYNGGNGIDVQNVTGGAYVFNNYVHDISDAATPYAVGANNGIFASNVETLNITENTVADINGDGVHVEDSTGAQISWNTISDVAGDGVFVDPSNQIDVYQNTITNSGIDGIHVDGGTDLFIYDNHIYNSANDGIHVDGYFGYASITGNTIDQTGDDGIETVDGDSVYIAGNTISNIGGYGGYYGDYYGADGIHVRDVGNDEDYGDVTTLTVSGETSSYYGYFGGPVDIENNTITDTLDDGIEVLDSGSTQIKDNMITNAGSYFGWYTGHGDYTGADGIHVSGVYGGYYGEASGGNAGNAGNADDGDTSDDGGYYVGYTLNIIHNTINQTGDDGIDVTDSGSTLIKDNNVQNSGASNFWGSGADYYGADGIHVNDVYGYYGLADAGSVLDGDIFPYAVVVVDNMVDTTGDDGIEVADSGRTLIRNNMVSNAGSGYATGDDGWGADGIHVRDVYADDILSFFGIGYDVEVTDNTVTNSGDDGVQVVYTEGPGNFSGFPFFDGLVKTDTVSIFTPDTAVGAFGNTVSGSGGNGIVVTNANFITVDGNTVQSSGKDGILVNTAYFETEDNCSYYGGYYGGYYGIRSFGLTLGGDNTIDVINAGGDYYGFFDNAVNIDGNNNEDGLGVDLSGNNGIEVNGYGNIEIGGNLVTNSTNDGILVTNLLSGGFVDEEPTFEIALVTPSIIFSNDPQVVIDGNTVDSSDNDGIHVDSFLDEGTSTVTVTDNAVTNSTNNALDVAGPDNGTVTVSGNSFETFDVGARFESGLIDLTGDTNFFFGGNVGLLFSPYAFDGSFADMSLVDDDGGPNSTLADGFPPANFGGTIGHQFFEGQSTYYVELANGAFFEPGEPTILNGLNSTYDGVTPSDTGGILTQAQFDKLEQMFFHYNDDTSLGLFWFGAVGTDETDLDEAKFFNQFGPVGGGPSGVSITLLGLPGIPGANGPTFLTPGALNAISTFAGGDSSNGLSPEELNKIESAAGGADDGNNNGNGSNGQKTGNGHTNCWNDAMNAAYSGKPVNYSFGTGAEDSVAGAAACGGGASF